MRSLWITIKKAAFGGNASLQLAAHFLEHPTAASPRVPTILRGLAGVGH